MKTILMTGGTGMVGRALSRMLVNKGYKVIILTRDIQNMVQAENISYAKWDINKKQIDLQAVQQSEYIIHLAGAGVFDKKWTAAYKKEIADSRTNSSRLIIDTLKQHSHSIKSVISASAIGWYGADHMPNRTVKQPELIEKDRFQENEKADSSFLGETCRLWEESIDPVTALGIRLVKLRIGIVLSNDGGALAEFKKPLRFGIGAVLGNGRQVVSWIHIEDLCRSFIHALENEKLQGSYNAVAPGPVTNKTLTLKLANIIKGKFFIPVNVPNFILKLLLGQRSIEVLKSATASCRKLKETGFVFLYPSIEAALQELVSKK